MSCCLAEFQVSISSLACCARQSDRGNAGRIPRTSRSARGCFCTRFLDFVLDLGDVGAEPLHQVARASLCAAW